MTWYTLCQRTLSGANQGFNGETPRQTWDVASYALGAPSTGTQLRFTFQAGPTGGLNWTSLYTGHRATSGDTTDFDGTQVAVLTSASAGGSIGSANGTQTTDAATYAFTKTKPLVAAFVCTFPGNCRPTTDADIHIAHTSDAASVTDATVSGAALDQVIIPTVEVWFDDPAGNATCTITKNTGQADPTSGNSIEFRVDFNKGMTGFTSGDVVLSASTVTWIGGTPSIAITGSDFSFIVTVTGMLTIGNVTLSIPASVCTAISDSAPNNAGSAVSVAWDPDIIGPGANVYDVCTVDRDLLRVEVRDPVVELGYYEEPVTPETGTGTYAITNVADNGKGQIRITTAYGAGLTNYYISAMANNGSGLIRCTMFDTSLLGSTVPIIGALGCTEANGSWLVTVISGTTFDLVGSLTVTVAVTSITNASPAVVNLTSHGRIAGYPIIFSTTGTLPTGLTEGTTYYVIAAGLTANAFEVSATLGGTAINTSSAGSGTHSISALSAFVNAYTGNAMIQYNGGSYIGTSPRITIHSVGGTTEANGSWLIMRSGATTLDLFDSHFSNAYTSGGTVVQLYIWVQRTNPALGANDYCQIVGRNGTVRRFQDIAPSADHYFNLAAALVPANYAMTGGLTVTAVNRKSKPYSSGWNASAAVTYQAPITSSRHYLYLQLSGNLSTGSYTLSFPAATGLPPKTFTFNDKATRCCAIHVDQNGHRPNDPGKFASLSEWVPEKGAHGEVDYSAVTAWYLIDTGGAVVATFGAPVLRTTPTSIEGLSLGAGDEWQTPIPVFDGGPPLKIVNVTRAAPGRVTVVDASTVSNGTLIAFSDMYHYGPGAATRTGMWQVETDIDGNPVYWRVANKSGNSFDLALPGAGFYNIWASTSTLAFDAFAQTTSLDLGNEIYKVNETGNRASTYVYGLDYSSFTTAGTYYIYIPDRGISDPIVISESRWWRAAKQYLKAIYTERAGCALDGRFGYTRPVNFKPSATQPIYKSFLPYCFSNYSLDQTDIVIPDVGYAIGSGGGYTPWITTTPSTQFGSHMDAGDWDQRFNETCFGYYCILDAWEHLPLAAKTSVSVMGTPTCLEAGLDPVIFAGTDGLPSPLVEAIWGIEQCRLSQEVSGAISGGTNYGEGGPDFETGWNVTTALYTWYPDHLITCEYVFVAAKLARLLGGLGYTSLASTYQTSAIAAYDWVVLMHTDTTARDAYYLPVKTRAGWTTGQYNTAMASLQSKVDFERASAAASLFALTGTTAYKTYCDSIYPLGSTNLRRSLGMWEYSNAAGASSTIRSAARTLYASEALSRIVVMQEAPDITYATGSTTGYWNMAFGAANNWIYVMPTMTIAAMIYKEDGDTTNQRRCLSAMQRIAQHRHGANQIGLCMVNGLGVRHNRETLHLDSHNSSQLLPAGLTSEGWSNQFFVAAVLFGDSSISKIQHPHYDPEMLPVDPLVPYREIFPANQLAWPRWELFIENMWAIEQSEFTTQQQLLPGYAALLYLHGFDGNAVTGEETTPDVTLPITSRRRFVSFSM